MYAPYDVPVVITPACSKCGRIVSWANVCETLDVLTYPGQDVIREWVDNHPACGKAEVRHIVRVVSR